MDGHVDVCDWVAVHPIGVLQFTVHILIECTVLLFAFSNAHSSVCVCVCVCVSFVSMTHTVCVCVIYLLSIV